MRPWRPASYLPRLPAKGGNQRLTDPILRQSVLRQPGRYRHRYSILKAHLRYRQIQRAQSGKVRLRITLVPVLYCRINGDVSRRSEAQARREGGDDLVEASASARAHVDYSAPDATVHSRKVQPHDVTDVDKVASLLACVKAPRPLVEAGHAISHQLAENLVDHRSHVALVSLPRPVGVEITEADKCAGHPVDGGSHVLIETQLASGVWVQGAYGFRPVGTSSV